jgi:hypothetical protein
MILPDWPSTTKWLTPEEKFLAVQRLAHDGIGNTGTGGDDPSHNQAMKAWDQQDIPQITTPNSH